MAYLLFSKWIGRAANAARQDQSSSPTQRGGARLCGGALRSADGGAWVLRSAHSPIARNGFWKMLGSARVANHRGATGIEMAALFVVTASVCGPTHHTRWLLSETGSCCGSHAPDAVAQLRSVLRAAVEECPAMRNDSRLPSQRTAHAAGAIGGWFVETAVRAVLRRAAGASSHAAAIPTPDRRHTSIVGSAVQIESARHSASLCVRGRMGGLCGRRSNSGVSTWSNPAERPRQTSGRSVARCHDLEHAGCDDQPGRVLFGESELSEDRGGLVVLQPSQRHQPLHVDLDESTAPPP